MHTEGEEVHISETEASGGSKEGVVRWVLIFGTLLAIIFLSAIWMTGALTQGEVEEEGTVSGQIAAEQGGDSTDSIVSDQLTDMEAAEPDSEVQNGLEVIENEPQETP